MRRIRGQGPHPLGALTSSVFTSARERRLWLWALAVMVAIYASLGAAPAVVGALRERNLLRVSFWTVALLVMVVFLWQWREKRPGWSDIGVALGVGLAYVWTFIRIENPAERTHLIEYGVVAALIHQALVERSRNGRPVRAPAVLTVSATALLGLLDEGLQAVLPRRVFDWNDVLFNALAGFMVIVARLALAPVRAPGWRLWFLWLVAGFIGWGWPMDPSSFGEGPLVPVSGSLPEVRIPRYASVLSGAGIVAVLQWLLLRRYLPGAALWVPASLVAAALGLAVVVGWGGADGTAGLIAGVAAYGTLAGALQWLVLRGRVPGAGWWIVANTVGWIVAIPVGDAAGPPGWAIYAAVTGTTLVWLLRRRPHPLDRHPAE